MPSTNTRLTSLAALLACIGIAAPTLAVGTRRFELNRGKDFEGGDLQGVAIDSSGRLHAGLNLGRLVINDAQSIWCTLLRPDGSLLLGTGNEGKLLEVRGGSVRVAAETKALAIPSVISAWGGQILLATMPGGEVLSLQGDKVSTFAKLEGAQHVWQLAFDASAGVVYAATGPEGKLFRIDRSGKAQVYFDAEEEHLMSLALRAQRTGPAIVYVGASDKAKLYEVRAPGRATVLYDFESTEVRGLVVSPRTGDLYAIANQIKSGSSIPSSEESGSGDSSRTKGKGVLFRFGLDGSPEQLLENSREHFVSLGVGEDGRPYVGTGVEGRIQTIDDAHNEVLVADTEERQVGALLLAGPHRFVATSDPAVLHPVRGVGGADALWTSKPLDAGLRAQFGRLSWTASGPLELSVRSGNTQEPDDTWSAWSAPLMEPGVSQAPPGRYVQVRARWNRDPQASLSDVTLPFVTDNLRAVVGSIEVDNRSKDDAGDGDLQSSGGPVTENANAVLKLKWKVENPDGDELRYRLQYTLVGGPAQWFDILDPRTTLTKTSYEWDTSDLPEGQYRVRVQASDELSNPPERVKRHELQSNLIIVDNTPPTITALEVKGRQVRGTALDGVGPIARIELSVAGSGEWYPFFPRDGIYDQAREDFDVDVSSLSPAGRVILSVRVYDAANNFVVRNVTLSP